MYKCLLKNCAAKSSFFIFILLSLSTPSFSYDFEGGTGEPNNPYRIATAEQLLQIGSDPNLLNKCYILLNDIDLDPNLTGIPPFTQAPIAPDTNSSLSGFQGTKFAGIFDGNSQKIRNLKIDTAGAGNDYLGLFGFIDGSSAQVKNLGIENIVIRGGASSWYLGGLCGTNFNSTLSNCYLSGQVTSGTDSVFLGSLCGRNYFGTLINCYSSGQVAGETDSYYLGVLCGSNGGPISNCYSTGQVTGGLGSYYLGGLCGLNDSGTLINSYSSGQVIGGSDSWCLGGLCGSNDTGIVINCYATGSVSGNDLLGGLCGLNYGTIRNCYSTGSVTGDLSKGGFCGYNDSGSFIGCFWDTETSTMTDGVGNMNPDPNTVQGKTTTQMKTLSTFTDAGWDFVNIWAICEGTNYPRLRWAIPVADLLCPNGVDFLDFAFFANFWLNSDCVILNDCDRCDFDLTGFVDSNDLNIFTTNWLQN